MEQAARSPGGRHFLRQTCFPRHDAAGIGAIWDNGEIYFTSGAGTRKSRNLAANPACTISAKLETIDMVLEGEAVRVSDGPTLERVAARCRESGWPDYLWAAETPGDFGISGCLE